MDEWKKDEKFVKAFEELVEKGFLRKISDDGVELTEKGLKAVPIIEKQLREEGVLL